MKLRKILLSLTAAVVLSLNMTGTVNAAKNSSINWTLTARYESGFQNPDGGVTEIVSYDKKNKQVYSVNGQEGTLEVIGMKGTSSDFFKELQGKKIDIKSLIEKEAVKNLKKYPFLKGFEYGDMTSVSVSPTKNIAAVAIQEKNLNKNGIVLLIAENGKIQAVIPAGKQPDMLTFSKSGRILLVANEGEPREGYADGTVDPEGSVTVIEMKHGYGNIRSNDVKNVDFKKFDVRRDELINKGVILKKNTMPSTDLEPEYIAIDSEERFAYVSLQEANSVAVLDLKKKDFDGVYGLGFKDYSVKGNEIDLVKDGEINIKTQKNTSGIRIPDGISVFEKNGETYILTANEGDAREWGEYVNEKKIKIDGEKVTIFDTSDYDGLFESGRNYTFGARSFSIFKVNKAGMELVFDSGADFEKKTAEIIPEYFNVSNNNVKMEDRSGKKGPEPETVITGSINDKTYAFVALERTGGIMVYDITNPTESSFSSFINTRDYSKDIAGDVAPEGLVFVSAKDSVTKTPLLIAANEVSGTVSVYSLEEK